MAVKGSIMILFGLTASVALAATPPSWPIMGMIAFFGESADVICHG
jgi:hypothetical protein